MKLREIKTDWQHYFKDEQGQLQGEYKLWHDNGQLSEISHHRDGRLHGEYKYWNLEGKPEMHTFDINGKEVIDFIESPELYPSTPEEKTMFVLKYGSAQFIKELLD